MDAIAAFERWDADADSELDSDEIDGNVFELFESDGDDTISRAEWESAAELWYPTRLDLVVFEDIDGDGDSEVDEDELKERFDLSLFGETWTTVLDLGTFKTAYFELYDQDDDGLVSRTELTAGSAVFGSPNE